MYSGPPAPYNITTLSSNLNQLDVQWDDRCAFVNDEIGCLASHVADVYTITYKVADGTELTAAVEDEDNVLNQAPPREITVNNLTSNTEYTFTIQIKGNGGSYEVFSDVSQPESETTSEFYFYYQFLKQQNNLR